MAWTKEMVEERIKSTNSFDSFIKNGGVLSLQICGGTVLFYVHNNDAIIHPFFQYPPNPNIDYACVKEFCRYAIPYLNQLLRDHRKATLCSPYCIEPICID